jgi:hypothetical protein
MGRLDLRAAGKIRNGPRQLEHPVAAPRREAEPFHRGSENACYFLSLPAVFPHLA